METQNSNLNERPVVFISYSQEHPESQYCKKVLRLAASLVQDGVDVRLDKTKASGSDWMTWMRHQFNGADYILCMINESYSRRFNYNGPEDEGLGVAYEARQIKQELYQGKHVNERMLPCYFHRSDAQFIPRELVGWDEFLLDANAGYERLLRKIHDRPKIKLPDPGPAPDLSTEEIEPLFSSASETASKTDSRTADRSTHSNVNDLHHQSLPARMEIVETLMARLDRYRQRTQLAKYRSRQLEDDHRPAAFSSMSVVAPGATRDSIKLFALCCLDKFIHSIDAPADDDLFEALQKACTVPLLADDLIGDSSRLGKFLNRQLEAGSVPDDGWAVFFCDLKSERQAINVSRNFMQWRDQAGEEGCRRKILLVLVWDESSLSRIGRQLTSLLRSDDGVRNVCRLDRLETISRQHVDDWCIYLRNRKHPLASHLDAIAQKIFGDSDRSRAMEEIRQLIDDELSTPRSR